MSPAADPRVIVEVRALQCQLGSGAARFDLHVDSLALYAGEALVVLGPNGAGKSTLLRALAGLEKTAKDSVIACEGGPVTLVFQRPATFSGSVSQNVGAALLGGIPMSMCTCSRLIAPT